MGVTKYASVRMKRSRYDIGKYHRCIFICMMNANYTMTNIQQIFSSICTLTYLGSGIAHIVQNFNGETKSNAIKHHCYKDVGFVLQKKNQSCCGIEATYIYAHK